MNLPDSIGNLSEMIIYVILEYFNDEKLNQRSAGNIFI